MLVINLYQFNFYTNCEENIFVRLFHSFYIHYEEGFVMWHVNVNIQTIMRSVFAWLNNSLYFA